jgi:outer membrane protein assembly factor BamE (lipoprotein component of BamABCDE complex)
VSSLPAEEDKLLTWIEKMTRSKMAWTAMSAFVAVTLLAGCATLEARRRLQEYGEFFSPLIGTAQRTDIVRKFGEPVRRDRIGDHELWYYHIPVRDSSDSGGSAGVGGGYAVGSDVDRYDDLTVEFDAKGLLKSWRGYIQR